MKLLAALAALVLAPTPPIEPQVYTDITTAALEGLRQGLLINDRRDVEYGGVVVEIPGNLYRISMPRTDDMMTQVTLPRMKLRGLKIVGDYHMHICAHSAHGRILSEKFSPADIASNNAFHTEGYLLDGCFGTVYRYDPVHGRQLNPADGPQSGDVIGWLPEIAE